MSIKSLQSEIQRVIFNLSSSSIHVVTRMASPRGTKRPLEPEDPIKPIKRLDKKVFLPILRINVAGGR